MSVPTIKDSVNTSVQTFMAVICAGATKALHWTTTKGRVQVKLVVFMDDTNSIVSVCKYA